MRVRSREHLGGELDSILTSCFVVASRCSSAWTGFAAIHAVSVIVLQGAGLSCLPCIGKDQIKSVPSNETSVSASRRFRFVPVLDNWCQKWDWRRDGTDDNEDDDGRQPCAPVESWGGCVPPPVCGWPRTVGDAVGCRCHDILYLI